MHIVMYLFQVTHLNLKWNDVLRSLSSSFRLTSNSTFHETTLGFVAANGTADKTLESEMYLLELGVVIILWVPGIDVVFK